MTRRLQPNLVALREPGFHLRFCAQALLAGVLFCTHAAAVNGARPRIIAVLEQSNAPFLPRLRGELAAAGFDLIVVSPASWPPTRQDIERITQREGAIAGLSLIQAGGGVEIWVVDRVTNKTVFREVIEGADDSHQDSIAIRFVETLRATLMEVEQPHSSRGDVAPPPEVHQLLKHPPSHFALSLSGGAQHSPGGLGTVGFVGLSVTGSPTPHFGLAVDGLLTPGRVKLRGPEGQASIGLFLFGASLRFCPVDPAGRLRLWLGAGGWVGVVTMTGEAVGPYLNARATTVSFIPHLDVGVRLSVTRHVSLGATTTGAISVPSVVVEFADRQVATWGRPLGFGALVIETTLD